MSNIIDFQKILEAQRVRLQKDDNPMVDALNNIEKQNHNIEQLAKRDILLQMAQTYELAQAEKDDDHIVAAVEKSEQEIKKGLLDTSGSGLNGNILLLISIIKKQGNILERIASNDNRYASNDNGIAKPISTESFGPPMPIMGLDNNGVDTITQRAVNATTPTTLKERGQSQLTKIQQDLFSLRGLLNTAGIVKKNTGGIFDSALQRREDTQEKIATFRQIDPASTLTDRQLNQQFKVAQSTQRDIKINENAITRLKKAGYSEDQMQNTGLLEKRETLATKLATVDPTLQSLIKKTLPNSEQTNEDNAQREKQNGILEKIEENTRNLGQQSPTGSKGGVGSLLEGAGALGIVGGIGGMFSSMIKSIGVGLAVLFSPKRILSLLGKLALPALIIGTIFSGVKEGLEEWKKTGSIGQALLKGLGGMLSFVSFGLFDEKTLQTLWKDGKKLFDDYIVTPFTSIFESVKQIFANLVDLFNTYVIEPLTNLGTTILQTFDTIVVNTKDLFDKYIQTPIDTLGNCIQTIFKTIGETFTRVYKVFKDFIASIHIPAISIPGLGEVTKPWYPFKEDTKTIIGPVQPDKQSVGPVVMPVNQSAENIYTKSKDNANKLLGATPSSTTSPVIINAPSTVNNSQNFSHKTSPRNNDSSYKLYQQSFYGAL